MVSVEQLLEEMDAILDKAMVVPLSGGKAMVNTERIRELIDDIRLHLPQEIRKARKISADCTEIVANARKEAESITRKAEERARALVDKEEVHKRATIQANEMVAQAQTKAREIRKGATDYSENIMRATEDIISQKLTELRQARQGLRTTMRGDSAGFAATVDDGSDDEG